MLWLGYSLRVSRHVGLPGAFHGLERYMETESLEEQLSGPGFYYLNFEGRRVSLYRWKLEFHFSL